MKIKTRTREQAFKHWVKALRSGEYKQIQGLLKDDSGFCCLGVLCDLAMKDGGPEWYAGYLRDEFLGIDTELPLKVRKFMGITSKGQSALITLNDDRDADFNTIADFIEKKYIKS